jgi:hypothetical protein
MRQCVVRPPSPEEVLAMTSYIKQQRQRLQDKQLDAATLAGNKDGDSVSIATWTLLARAVMNTDEFVTKE